MNHGRLIMGLLSAVAGAAALRAAEPTPPAGIAFSVSTNQPVQRRLRRTYDRRVNLRGEGESAVQPPPASKEQRKPEIETTPPGLKPQASDPSISNPTRQPLRAVTRPKPASSESPESDVWILDSVERILGGGKQEDDQTAEPRDSSNWLVESVARAAEAKAKSAAEAKSAEKNDDATGQSGLINQPGQENPADANRIAGRYSSSEANREQESRNDPNSPRDERKPEPVIRPDDFRNTAGNFAYTNSPTYRDWNRDLMAERETAASLPTNAPVALDAIASLTDDLTPASQGSMTRPGGMMSTEEMMADVFGVEKEYRPIVAAGGGLRDVPPPAAAGSAFSETDPSVRAGGLPASFEPSGRPGGMSSGASALSGNPALQAGWSSALAPAMPSTPVAARPSFSAPTMPPPAPPRPAVSPSRPARGAPDVMPGVLPSMR